MSNERSEAQKALFQASGEVEIAGDRLTCFLYMLMRDHLTPGKVAEIFNESVADGNYTNGWLAMYARYIAEELRGGTYQGG